MARRWEARLFALFTVLAVFGAGRTSELRKPIGLGVAFQPRGFHEIPTLRYPSLDQLKNDLRLLRSAGFRSLVTYGSADVLGRIPELARAAGFDGVIIMGIWDPFSAEERRNAVAQAGAVDAYCLGNEGLGVRYRPDELSPRMNDLRKLTGKPVTTSEPLTRYLEGPDAKWLTDNSDWLFPTAHPYLSIGQGGAPAVNWIIARTDYLAAVSRKTLILKETGFPTKGAEACNEDTQLDFFRRLSHTGIQFFFFEAFDQPNKQARGSHPEVEHYWGLYGADGTPKRVVQWLTSGGSVK